MDRRVISKLAELDPTFRDVYGLLYPDSEIAKMGDPSEVHVNGTNQQTKKKKLLAGGLLLGTGIEALAAKDTLEPLAAGIKTAKATGTLKPLLPSLARGNRTLGPALKTGLQAGNFAVGLGAAKELLKKPKQQPGTVAKSFTWTGEISKVDEDKRQVFGWASISEINGEPVLDLQGDIVPIEETEKAAYRYVIESRKGGDMHARVKKGLTTEWTEPKHTADLVESFVVTPEKLEKMGLPSDALPLGWWVGFKVNDDEQWNLVKSGKRTGFSIHGSGTRKDLN
jgi:hypothetical protein